MLKPKMNTDERDQKIEAIKSLMGHWGWKSFQELIMYKQGIEQSKLFEKKFMDLTPLQKDKYHFAIVEVLKALSGILELQNFLEKRDPSRWSEVTSYLNKGE